MNTIDVAAPTITARPRGDLLGRVRWWLVAAIAALAGSVMVLAETTEDVTQRDGLFSSDASHLRFFIDHRPPWMVQTAKVLTQAGAFPLLIGVAIIAAVLLWWRGAIVIVAVAPAVALTVAAISVSIEKQVVGRARPPAALRLVNETSPAFPSGHATDSAALYVSLALVVAVFMLRRPLARVAVVCAGVLATVIVGTSRLVLGVHWPTDVLAGWALGTTSALMVVLVVAWFVRRASSNAGVDLSRARRSATSP